MQPRVLLIGFTLFVAWGLYQHSLRNFIFILILGSIVMSIFPMLLVFRNAQATGKVVVSSQFAGTMMGGFGDGANGAPAEFQHLKCRPALQQGNISTADAAKCVLAWNLKHPVNALQLIVKKSIYFWSPWSGPLVTGTAARNPWLKVDPWQLWVQRSAAGQSAVNGWFGKIVSWLWLLGGLFFLGWGFLNLWRMGEIEKQIGVLVAIPIAVEWLISIGTYGDHRYRIPTMGMSLFLQVIGIIGLKNRLFRPPKPATLVAKPRTR